MATLPPYKPLPKPTPGKGKVPGAGLVPILSQPNPGPGGGPQNSPIPLLHPAPVPHRDSHAALTSVPKPRAVAVTLPHPLAAPKPPPAKPVVTHPHTIQVTPGAGTVAPTYSSAPPTATVPPAPTVTTPPAPRADTGKSGFYTKKANVPLKKGQTIGYTKGKGYYAVPAPVKGKGRAAAAAAATTTTSAAAPSTTDTTGTADTGMSMQDQIDAQLKAELDPQTAAINSGYTELLAGLKAQQDKARLDAAAQAQTIQGYYGALTPLLQGIAPAVQGGYQQAANAQAAAAKGFSGALGDTATADANQSAALLGANGAPDAQTAAAAQAAGVGGGAANALYGLGGFIPSAELSAQGAAAGAAARQLPATYAGVGAQNAAQALGVGARNVADIGTTISEAGQKHADDLATLLAGVPKLRNDITDHLTALQTAKDATAYAHGQDTLNRATHAKEYAAAQKAGAAAAKAKADWAKFTQILATGRDPLTGELTPKARAQIAAISGVDPVTGQPTLAARKAQTASDQAQARINQGNVREQRAQSQLDLTTMKTLSEITGVVHNADGSVATGADGKPMLTPAGRRAALAQWKANHPASKGGFTKAQLAKISSNAEKMADTQFYGKFAKDGTTVVTPAVQDYQQALSQQLAAGVPLQVAQRALNAFYPVGQEGRPYVPVQARVRLEAAGLPMQDPLAPPNQAQQAWMRAHGISWSG